MNRTSTASAPTGRLKKHAVILTKVIMIVLVSRLLLYGIGYLALNLFPAYNSPPLYETETQHGQTFESLALPEWVADTKPLLLSDLYKFDVYSYAKIAEFGYDQYKLDEPHPPANWVFFPLYPLLTKAFSLLTPWWSIHTAGVVLSNLLLVAALYVIYLIGLERKLLDEDAGQILFMIIAYPASLYFSLMYTESLFLLLSALSLYLAMTKRYFWAFMAAGLSTVTRVPGVANLVFVGGTVLLDLVGQRKWRFRLSDARYLLYAALSVIPLLSYFAYIGSITGSFLAPVHEQDNWGRAEAFPFQSYLHYFRAPYFILGGGGWDNGVLSFTMATLVLGVFLLYGIKNARHLAGNLQELLFFGYGLVLVTIPFSSSPTLLTSIIRYMMVSIPFYFYWHCLTRNHGLIRQFSLALMLMINVIITICFVRGYFFVV